LKVKQRYLGPPGRSNMHLLAARRQSFAAQ
jgi:hypothetical protein